MQLKCDSLKTRSMSNSIQTGKWTHGAPSVHSTLSLCSVVCRIAETIAIEDFEEVLRKLKSLSSVLDQYSYLAGVREDKPGLFFSVLMKEPETVLPIVYTPGVGDACLNWGRLKKRPTGLTLKLADAGSVAAKMKKYAAGRDIDAVVVTDGACSLPPVCYLQELHRRQAVAWSAALYASCCMGCCASCGSVITSNLSRCMLLARTVSMAAVVKSISRNGTELCAATDCLWVPWCAYGARDQFQACRPRGRGVCG